MNKKKKRGFRLIMVILVFFALIVLVSSSNLVKINVLSQNSTSTDLSNYKYSYEYILNSDSEIESKKELLFFTASWCGSCTKLRSILQEASKDLGDAVIYEVDLEEQRSLANINNVNFAPTLIYKNGEEIKRIDEFDLSQTYSLISYISASK